MANTTAAVHRIALPQGGFPWSPYIVPIIISYSLLCSQLRFQRRDAMQKKYNFPDRRSLSQMTNVQAQEILQYLTELEFPHLGSVRTLQGRTSKNTENRFNVDPVS
jgi:hypothetical protein